MTPFCLAAPAKINLDLRVFPPDPSGFHPLHSWFRTIDLADSLRFEPNDAYRLRVEGADVGATADNLVTRAWRTCESAAREQVPVAITLDKRIPHGGGLGGGSSDAAAAIAGFGRVLAEQSGQRLPKSVLRDVAAKVGSDVPFFLADQLANGGRATAADPFHATCTGRGERVAPFRARRLVPLLILPDLHVPTPAVFAQFDERPAPPPQTPEYARWSQLDAAALLPQLANDLEAAAFALHPELAQLRDVCEGRLKRPVRMSGSGGTLFALFDTPAAAGEAGELVHDLVRTQLG